MYTLPNQESQKQMRCLSCGFVNAPHAFECARCKNILDPIAAAATVGYPAEPAQSAPPTNYSYPFGDNQNGTPGAGAPPPPVPNYYMSVPPPISQPVPPPNLGKIPARRQIVQADEEYLSQSQNAARMVQFGMQEDELREAKCKRCGKIAMMASGEFVCRECVAKQTSGEYGLPLRTRLLAAAGGLLAGGAVAAACVIFAPNFLVSGRTVNWLFFIPVGLLIGLAVRLGSLNRPNLVVQVAGALVGTVGLSLILYTCLTKFNGGVAPALNPDTLFTNLKAAASIMDYFWLALAYVLPFGIPSNFFGGNSAED